MLGKDINEQGNSPGHKWSKIHQDQSKLSKQKTQKYTKLKTRGVIHIHMYGPRVVTYRPTCFTRRVYNISYSLK